MDRRELIAWFGKATVVWFEHNWLIVVFVIFFILQYIFAKKIKRRLARKYKYNQHDTIGDQSYMTYYKKNQLVDLVRFASIAILLGYLIAFYESGFFSVLAIALGAFIITFQSLILGFGIYFYLLSQYRVGDTIKIGTIAQGEIMYIEPLYIALAAKNDDGDHIGHLHIIPNHIVRGNNIVKITLALRSYTKQVLRVGYDPRAFSITFDEFVHQLEYFLNHHLPMPKRNAYKHYQSYIGFRYKLDFEPGEMKEKGQVMYVDIGFIVLLMDAAKYKRAILSFLDTLYEHRSPQGSAERIASYSEE